MIRIAAVIVLMASPAWAECALPHGMTPGICSGDDGIISIQNNGLIAVTGTTAPPKTQFCNQRMGDGHGCQRLGMAVLSWVYLRYGSQMRTGRRLERSGRKVSDGTLNGTG